MNPVAMNTKPRGVHRGAGIERKGARSFKAPPAAAKPTPAKRDHIPDNWRDRMPDPATYYGQHVTKLSRTNATGWAQGVCPFHEDKNKSLSVCMAGGHGGWRCFAGCGGGDLVGFHSRLRGMTFRAAVRDLLGGGA